MTTVNHQRPAREPSGTHHDDARHLTRDERDLIVKVSAYLHAAGWRMGGARGGLGNFVAPDKSLDADWWSYHRADSTILQISTLSQLGTPTGSVCYAEVRSVSEAVDIGCAYGLLPLNLSSAYRAAQADDASTLRYTEPLDLTAGQVRVGWLLCGSVMDNTGAELPTVEMVTAVRSCATADCVNRHLWDHCIVMDLDGDLRDEATDVHFAADTTLQARIPAGQTVAADDDPRCPDLECGEPLRLIAAGTVGHCGRTCADQAVTR